MSPSLSLFFNGSDPVLRPGQAAAHSHTEGVRPHMAADAEGKRIGEDAAVLRERVHRHLPPVLQCGGVLIAAGHGDVDVPLGGKPLRVATNGLQQLFLDRKSVV